MKWLQNNVLGVILASACGFLLLVAILLAWMGTRPASGIVPGEAELDLAMADRADPEELGPLGRYRVVTDRPLFNQTRRPTIDIEESEQAEGGEQQAEVTEAPQVNLTGVVITPELRLVSLTPSGGGEPLVFGEGSPMRGEYNGWTVSQVLPRSAVLESSRGGKVELELMVHDEKIKEPPKVIPASPSPAEGQQDDLEEGQEDERLSRAEEIRQRIAERREQLRQEAAENRAGQDADTDERGASAYASAIRNLMGEKDSDKDQEKDDDED